MAQETPDLYTCLLNTYHWRQIHEEYDGAKRLFAKIRTESGKEAYCALGHPVIADGIEDEDEEHPIFLAPWLLTAIGLEGSGEYVEVEWLTEEAFPAATSITLRAHENAFHQTNVRDELEPVLTRYGVLEVGKTIPVPIESMGGYVILFDVVGMEPTKMSLMEGDEVEILFEEALDAPKPLRYQPFAVAESKDEMLEEVMPQEPEGQRLGGGETRPRLADGRPWNPWR